MPVPRSPIRSPICASITRSRLIALFVAGLLPLGPARADPAPFDLAGPALSVTVTHGATKLPIDQVPNLSEGDRIAASADLPRDQGVRYLLVAAFLRGATNPPPKSWFTQAKTWDRKKAALDLTVPAGARQLILFLAPETGGGYDAIVDAVRKQPGAFVRASQELNQASLDRARLDTFLESIHRLERTQPERIETVSPVLTRSLSITLKAECLEQAIDLQAACLTQSRSSLLLADSHSASLTETLVGAPTDLALQLAATPEGGLGYYSPYIGVVRDLARIFGAFQSTQFQYIPALARAAGARLSLLLNAAPSFAKPKSVMVAALPAIEPPEPPPLRTILPAKGAIGVLCRAGAGVLLPVEGAPLIYATRYAHAMAVRVTRADGSSLDLPVTADVERGGFLLSGASGPGDPGTAFDATLHGIWGFTPFDGPRFRLQSPRPGSWRAIDGASLVAGRDNSLTLDGGAAACVEELRLARPSGTTEPLAWTTLPDGRIRATIPKAQLSPGPLSLLVRQQGIAETDTIALTALTEVGRIDGFTLHAGDSEGRLTGTRLDMVATLTVDGAVFAPGEVVRSGKTDARVMTAAAAAPVANWSAGQEKAGRVTLKDGRVLPVTIRVAAARPAAVLIDRTVARASAATPALPIAIPDGAAVPQDARLTFSIRAQGATRFTGREQIEVATLDGPASATIKGDGYAVQSPEVAIASIDPARALGTSAYGPLRFRIVQDGVAGDWTPLVSLVRLPTLTSLTCDKGAAQCLLSGDALYLLAAVAGDASFAGAVVLPDGYTAGSIAIPRPTGPLFLKLRDDPTLVATARPVITER